MSTYDSKMSIMKEVRDEDFMESIEELWRDYGRWLNEILNQYLIMKYLLWSLILYKGTYCA
jgi:hypothetical protein